VKERAVSRFVKTARICEKGVRQAYHQNSQQ